MGEQAEKPKGSDLDKAEVEELLALRANQPVEGGYTISPNAIRRLVKKKLAFWWECEGFPRGWRSSTDATRATVAATAATTARRAA